MKIKKCKISLATTKGPRPYQEDFYLHLPVRGGRLLAIMDGHGGKETAEFCAEKIPRLFNPAMDDEPTTSLRNLVRELNQATRTFEAGTTISLAYILEERGIVATAVLGDSPIIVIDAKGFLRLSEDHNVRTNAFEAEAVQNRGGLIEKGYIIHPHTRSSLQLTRALGDAAFDDFLNREPAVTSFKINSKSVVIVASDGVIDPFHYVPRIDEVKKLLKFVEKGRDASWIISNREKEELRDNATLILWQACI